MIQLKCNDNFTDLVNSKPEFISDYDDMPLYIKDFVNEISNSRIIYDIKSSSFCCLKCFKKISDYYCDNCKIKYKKNKKQSIIYDCDDTDDLNNGVYKYIYYAFLPSNEEVLLYQICETIKIINNYNNLFVNKFIEIRDVFWLTKTNIYSLKNDFIFDFIEYKKLEEKYYNNIYSDDDLDRYIELSTFDGNIEQYINKQYLYVDNLVELKNSRIYKYSFIWEAKNYLKKDENIDLKSITYYPICVRQFEYLIKLKLYSLAFDCPSYFKYGKTFKDIFGVDKKYYQFMKKIDIDWLQLGIMNILI